MQSGIKCTSIVGLCTLALLSVVSCKPSRSNEESSAALKPINVVVITLDTVRADHLHCYGYEKIKTPNIDSLAKNGVLFEKAVAQTPLTQPSHASMFTGTNPNVHNVRDTGGFVLQPSSVTLATILHKHGWNTAAFISSSVLKKLFGFDQGFAVYDDRMSEAGDSATGKPDAVRPANITVDHALNWLNTQSDKPFFAWLHLYDAHRPYKPPPQFQKEYPNNAYDAEIAFEDQQLGRFLNALKQKSPASRTMVILLSDHGESLGDHGEYEHGVFLYDSTVRIAWIMTGPGIPAGIRVQQQAREIDLLPTILEVLGGKPSSDVQGISMAPVFSGKTLPTTYSYEETLYPELNMGWSALRGIHTTQWMYVRAPKPELYNLVQDPGELHNIIDSHPKEYREMEAQLKKSSRMDKDGKEMVVVNKMDQTTMEQLKSLGYAAGTSDRTVELNDKGPDPKDHVATLKILEIINGPNSENIPTSRKIELLQPALKDDPTNPSVYFALIQQYERAGQDQQALQVCLDALNHNIRDGMIISQLANLYLHQGNQTEAIKYYEEATQLNPLDVDLLSNLGVAYSQNGRFDDAEHVFRQVLTIQPYPRAYNGLGIIAIKRNDTASARKNFEHAVQLDPSYLEGQLNLGILCTKAGDRPCGRAAFQAFLAKAPPQAFKDVIPRVKYALNTVLAQ